MSSDLRTLPQIFSELFRTQKQCVLVVLFGVRKGIPLRTVFVYSHEREYVREGVRVARPCRERICARLYYANRFCPSVRFFGGGISALARGGRSTSEAGGSPLPALALWLVRAAALVFALFRACASCAALRAASGRRRAVLPMALPRPFSCALAAVLVCFGGV